MDLVNLLSKLQAISEANDKSDKDYDGDGKVESDKDEVWGSRMKAANKSKANEDIENVLRGLAAIREGNLAECGEMEMDMSPLTAPDAGIEMQPMAAIQAMHVEPDGDEQMAAQQVDMGQEEESPKFTLSIQNGDSNLSMTTDIPDEIIHVMKLAGVKGEAKVEKAEPEHDAQEEQGEDKEVDEAWGNTPDATNEREPKAYGDIRDWALKGTGQGKPGYGDRRAQGQGDNPMTESAMFAEYKKFKAGK
jgi:hypothetical protein